MEVSSASLAAVSQQQQYPVARSPQESRPAREREGETQRAQAQPSRKEMPQQTEQTQRAVQAEQTERQEKPKPVVNAQGQKTGTIINITA